MKFTQLATYAALAVSLSLALPAPNVATSDIVDRNVATSDKRNVATSDKRNVATSDAPIEERNVATSDKYVLSKLHPSLIYIIPHYRRHVFLSLLESPI